MVVEAKRLRIWVVQYAHRHGIETWTYSTEAKAEVGAGRVAAGNHEEALGAGNKVVRSAIAEAVQGERWREAVELFNRASFGETIYVDSFIVDEGE